MIFFCTKFVSRPLVYASAFFSSPCIQIDMDVYIYIYYLFTVGVCRESIPFPLSLTLVVLSSISRSSLYYFAAVRSFAFLVSIHQERANSSSKCSKCSKCTSRARQGEKTCAHRRQRIRDQGRTAPVVRVASTRPRMTAARTSSPCIVHYVTMVRTH